MQPESERAAYGHGTQGVPQSVRCAHDGVVDHLQGDTSRCDGRLAASRENPQGFDHAVPASRRDRPLAGEGGMGSVLCIEIVVLAAPAPIMPIRRRHFQNLDARLLHEAQQASAIAAGRLNANAVDIPERSHPRRAFAGIPDGSWQSIGFRERDPVHRRPPRHADPYGYPRHRRRGACFLHPSRPLASSLDRLRRLRQDRVRRTGQLRDQTVRPFSGHRHRRGKTSPRGVPGRPTGPRKDTNGRSECGSDRTGTPCGASLPNGPSL